MPTDKPRITVTLEPETYALLRDYASATGQPMARFVSELLDQVRPSMARTLSLILAARAAPQELKDDLTDLFEGVEVEVRETLGDSVAQLDLILEELQKRGAEPPSCNTGVTTQPPTPKKPGHGTSRG